MPFNKSKHCSTSEILRLAVQLGANLLNFSVQYWHWLRCSFYYHFEHFCFTFHFGSYYNLILFSSIIFKKKIGKRPTIMKTFEMVERISTIWSRKKNISIIYTILNDKPIDWRYKVSGESSIVYSWEYLQRLKCISFVEPYFKK